MTRILEIGESIIIRQINTLIGGAKYSDGKNYLRHLLGRLIDSAEDLILMEVCRISQEKYQLCFVVTEDDSYNMKDDNVFFTADWYDIKWLEAVQIVKYNNDLFGECEELRLVCEATLK